MAENLYWQEKNTNRGFREMWEWQTNKRDEISNPLSRRDTDNVSLLKIRSDTIYVFCYIIYVYIAFIYLV